MAPSSLTRYVEAARTLRGWELEFEPEPLEDGPPWDYESRARALGAGAESLLDLGTGGGEVLSRVLEGFRGGAVATEAWHPNAPIAARRLAGRAGVVRASSLELPFPDARFDLVLSRHEEIEPREVARLLRPGGRFLTQQVISDHWRELREVFPDMTRFPPHETLYPEGLRTHGLELEDFREFRRKVRFRELGPLVYHLIAAPWIVPGFDVETHRAALDALERRLAHPEGLVLSDGVYLLEARAPIPGLRGRGRPGAPGSG